MISVIIATHNRCALLARTIEAIRAQTWPPHRLEIIVVDNGSSDGTRALLEREACVSREPALIVLDETRPGKSYAVNTGVPVARGSLLVFTDDDVVPQPHWLSALWKAVEETEADFAVGRIRPLWEARPPDWLSDRLYGVIAVPDNGTERLVIEKGRNEQVMPIGANMALRPAVIARIGGWRTDLGKLRQTLRTGEDHEFYLRMLNAGMRGVYEPEALVGHIVPADRLDRAYFRRWLHNNGRIVAGLEREYPTTRRYVLGVPAYLWREAAAHAIRSVVPPRGSARDRFWRLGRLLWFAGYLRGAWRPPLARRPRSTASESDAGAYLG